MRSKVMIRLFPFGTLIEIGKLQDHLSKVSNIFLLNVITEQLEKSRFRVKTRLKPGTSHEPKLIMSKSC